MQALLSSTYFGPVQWYQKLCRYERVLVERYDTYRKQTYRNRCVIATAAGPQALTIPVERPADGSRQLTKDVRISDHGNWRRLHWHALQAAYSESPFFDYYADDLRPFYERRWEFLYDFNAETCATVCALLDIHPTVIPTDSFAKPLSATRPQSADIPSAPSITQANHASSLITHHSALTADFRDAIDPKHPLPDSDFEPRRYYQVFERKNGFLPNLSILDLLFNMGPEGIFWLVG